MLNCRGKKLDFQRRTLVMGILNVTPDSFSDGGHYFDSKSAIDRGIQLEQDGADILDIGAESTRPGSLPVSVDEEIARLESVVEALLSKITIPISIDTYKATVADHFLKMGVHIINDISGLRFDPQMPAIVGQHNVPVVIMHIKGTPSDMQINPHYDDLMGEISDYLLTSIQLALNAGIRRENIIIDPGIGFGKRLQDNFEIIRKLQELKKISCPILVGPSRKSFIGKVLQLEPEQRVEGTAAAVALSIFNGADLVRVHDVKAMVRVCRITDLIVGKMALEEYGT
jgi:dihydropteroate synthase